MSKQYRNKYASNIVGTFSNGTFHGHGKVTFEDGSILLSEFIDGVPAGFSRIFQSNGDLLEIFYENKKTQKGYKWIKLHPNYLFYTNAMSFLNDHSDSIMEPNCIIIPLNATKGMSINITTLDFKYFLVFIIW